MPDRRSHRGPHPEDERLFRPAVLPDLRRGVNDLSWLLSRGYAVDSAVKLVGDRYGLDRRQRLAVARCAAADEAVAARESRRLAVDEVKDQSLAIDGYNLLTTIEAALGGCVILLGRDGCCRDMASMHGTYRKVSETTPAIELIGRAIAALSPAGAHWLLDSPVSNSGRLASLLRHSAAQHDWNWTVELVTDPDPILSQSTDAVVVTADSVVLDRCNRWCNLARTIVERDVAEAWTVDLSLRGEES